MACEICGADVDEVGCWIQCPIHLDSICHRHCYSCDYHGEAGSMIWCSFRQVVFVPDEENEKSGGENTEHSRRRHEEYEEI